MVMNYNLLDNTETPFPASIVSDPQASVWIFIGTRDSLSKTNDRKIGGGGGGKCFFCLFCFVFFYFYFYSELIKLPGYIILSVLCTPQSLVTSEISYKMWYLEKPTACISYIVMIHLTFM